MMKLNCLCGSQTFGLIFEDGVFKAVCSTCSKVELLESPAKKEEKETNPPQKKSQPPTNISSPFNNLVTKLVEGYIAEWIVNKKRSEGMEQKIKITERTELETEKGMKPFYKFSAVLDGATAKGLLFGGVWYPVSSCCRLQELKS